MPDRNSSDPIVGLENVENPSTSPRTKFYLNGIKMDFELKLGPKFSAPYPALSIANGARIEANFSGSIEEGKAWHAFPEECGDYSGIVAARQLL